LVFQLDGGLFRIVFKLSLLAIGIGAIIAFANLSDVGGWKQDLQDRVLNLSGRRLDVDGQIDFEVSYPPRIVAEGVRIENAPWGSKRDMFKAEKLIAEVDLLPLLVGDVAVPRIRFVGVDILIETNASGETNWDDLNSFQTAAGGPAAGPSFPVFGPTLGSGGIGFSSGTVTLANIATGVVNQLTIPEIPVEIISSGSGSNVSVPCSC